MKRLLALILMISTLAGLFSGCSIESLRGPDPVKAKTAAEEESAEEEETAGETEDRDFGLAWEPDGGLNPYSSDCVTNLPIQSLLYEELFIVNSNFEAEPMLCDSYKVSEDKRTWVFHIREDVFFSDGSNMTAEDVVASWQAAATSSFYMLRFRTVAWYAATGDYEITLVLSVPCENICTSLDVPICRKDSLKKDIPTGSGPYYLYARGSKLYRNKKWWGDTPMVDVAQINLIQLDSADDVRYEFEFGDADAVYTDPYMYHVAEFHGDNEPYGITTTVMQYLGFNLKSLYCSTPSFRSALTYGIDRESIIRDIYDGYGEAASLPCSSRCSWYDGAQAASYAFNTDTLRNAYRASGISADPSNTMKIIVCDDNPRRIAAAQYIADTLTQNGIYTDIKKLDRESFLYALYDNNYDAYLAEIRLPNNFDLNCFFGGSYYVSISGYSTELARTQCDAAMEDSANFYNLYQTVMTQGLITPIMFKTTVLYTTRGTLNRTNPSISNLLQCTGTGSMEDIYAGEPDNVY